MTDFQCETISYHLFSTSDDAQLHQLLFEDNTQPITLLSCHPTSSQTVISLTTNVTWQKAEAISDWATRRQSNDRKNMLLFTLMTLPDNKSSLASIKKQIHDPIFKNSSASMFIIIDEAANNEGGLGHDYGLQLSLGEMLVLLDVCARDRISTLTGHGYCDIHVSGRCVRAHGEQVKKVQEILIVTCQSSSNHDSNHIEISPADMKIGSDGGGRERIAIIAANLLGLNTTDTTSSSSSSSSNNCTDKSSITNSNGVDINALVAFVSRFADSVARDRLTKGPHSTRPTVESLRALATMIFNDTSTQPTTSSSSSSSTSSSSLPANTLNHHHHHHHHHHHIKALPTHNNNDSQTNNGLSVYEFFSGIGGMRVALPDRISGIPITHIESFDISDTANKVYALNFHDQCKDSKKDTITNREETTSITSKEVPTSSSPPHPNGSRLGGGNIRGGMHPILIERLSLADVDGKADIWTMSPPCQPFTQQVCAKRLDDHDPRSQGFLHIMWLLLHMQQRPRWILLENVKGFVGSNILTCWQLVLKACGYNIQQYLLSPVTSVGVPNHRMRFYMICEGKGKWKTFLDRQILLQQLQRQQLQQQQHPPQEADSDDTSPTNITNNNLNLEATESPIHTVLPPHIAQTYSSIPHPIGTYLLPDSEILCSMTSSSSSSSTTTDTESDHQLFVSKDLLSQPWAADRLSIVGQHCRRSYCFTYR